MQSAATIAPAASQRDARPPAWFRFAVLATATLILCSCQSAKPQAGTTRPNIAAATITDSNIRQAAFTQPVQSIPHSTIRNPQSSSRVLRCNTAEAPCPTCNPQFALLPLETGRNPQTDEYLCDGGDANGPVGIREDWEVEGLGQEDTVAHYDTIDGRTVVTPSNRVCIYAPKFGVVRHVVDLHQYARIDMAGGFDQNLSLAKIDEREEAATSLAQLEPSIHRARQPSSLLRERQQAGELDRERRVAVSLGSLAAYANLQIIRTGTASQEEKARVARSSLAAITWSGDQGPQILIDSQEAQAAVSEKQVGTIYHLHEPNKSKLRLVKLASTSSAQLGEIVEFTLRYDNIGNRVIGNVTIVDNLTTRLEYVPDSAKSSLESDFSADPNEGGSQVLRWEIRDPVEPGKGGVLQFKCRVR